MTKTELARDLEEQYEIIKEAAFQIKVLLRELPRFERERAKAYWYASLVQSLDNDHEYVGNSPETLLSTIEKLQSYEEEGGEEE